MNKLAALLGVGILCLSAGSMRADGIGTPVTGTLSLASLGTDNGFDSAFGFVPSGYGNSGKPGDPTVTITGAGNDFGFSNTTELITVSFTGTTATITSSCLFDNCVIDPFTITLTDPVFTSFSTVLSDSGYGLISFSGDTLTTSFSGESFKGQGTATELLSYTAVPEPGTLGLLATGLLGAAGIVRRRFIS